MMTALVKRMAESDLAEAGGMARAEIGTFGELLWRYRRERSFTQQDLAERAGLSERAIRGIERGLKHRPRKETVELLAEALELSGAEREVFRAASRQARAADLPDTGCHREKVATADPANLPDEPTPFIGREREIGEVVELLQQQGIRLVTLTGTGGTGKTRLALQVAAQLLSHFERSVFFVSLASVSDPDLVLSTIGDTMGVKEREGMPLIEVLTLHLKEKHLLLILDNFEHLLDAAAGVAALLDACRELHILVTSRIPLRLTREHEYWVPPLSVPELPYPPALGQLCQYEAVALFIERARAAKPSFALTEENALAVAKICQRLDGLPLSIVLAASRIKLFPPKALLQRLSSRLELLTGGARDLPARHQTLRAAIDWSDSLLSQGERILFARLSVFAGGCTLEAAEAVCKAEGDLGIEVLDGLASLVEKSLVQQDGEDEPRFGMLETIREYASERLEQSGQAERIRTRHATHYLTLAEEAERGLDGPAQSDWLAQLEREKDNLRVALAWLLQGKKPEGTLRLAGALAQFWITQGALSEGRGWLEAALAGGSGEGLVRAKALYGLGDIRRWQGDFDQAAELWEESLRLRREEGDEVGVASSLHVLAIVAGQRGFPERARSLYKESLSIFRRLNNKRGIADVSFLLGGSTALGVNDHQDAAALLQESLDLYRQLGHTLGIARTLHHIADLELERGDQERAQTYAEEALALSQRLRDNIGIAITLDCLSQVATALGDYPRAVARARECVDVNRTIGRKLGLVLGLRTLGIALANQGEVEAAREVLREALMLGRGMRLTYVITLCLEGLAAVEADDGRAEQAARLLGAAEAVREQIGPPQRQADRTLWDHIVATTRTHLNEVAWREAREEGRAMTLEQAVADALGENRED